MKQTTSATVRRFLVASGVCLALALPGYAQVQTKTSTTVGAATRHVTVERGTVVLVSGNDLFVRMADGTLRSFRNVPDSARITVDGKQLGIHDLKPGMTLQRTITTTTTPQMVTTVQTVTGKVWYVSPPSHVILTLADGKNQSFTIPKGQKFNIGGQMLDAWGLQKGMMISATKVVETPVTAVVQARSVSGEMPPPPPPPPDVPVLIVIQQAPPPQQVAEAAPAPEPAPQQLPKTGSELPLIGLLGLLCVGFSLSIRRFSRP
jgi:LPXTG-motif cell wall-anchored protein